MSYGLAYFYLSMIFVLFVCIVFLGARIQNLREENDRLRKEKDGGRA